MELERSAMCGRCCACSSTVAGNMRIEADNSIGATIGERVGLDIKVEGILPGIIIIYLLPAVTFIFGIIIGSRVSEIFGILLGLILMLFSFRVARSYGRRRISYSARITEIIKIAAGV